MNERVKKLAKNKENNEDNERVFTGARENENVSTKKKKEVEIPKSVCK